MKCLKKMSNAWTQPRCLFLAFGNVRTLIWADFSVRHKGTNWQHPFHSDLAWPSVSENPCIHPSVYFLVVSQMSWWCMLDVDCFLCKNPKEIKLFREKENASLSLWSGHNCIHTVGLLRQMLEHTVISIRGKPLPMKLKKLKLEIKGFKDILSLLS